MKAYKGLEVGLGFGAWGLLAAYKGLRVGLGFRACKALGGWGRFKVQG